jgi:hypothetical protein
MVPLKSHPSRFSSDNVTRMIAPRQCVARRVMTVLRADQIDAAMFKPLYSSAKSKLHELIADEV